MFLTAACGERYPDQPPVLSVTSEDVNLPFVGGGGRVDLTWFSWRWTRDWSLEKLLNVRIPSPPHPGRPLPPLTPPPGHQAGH